MRIGINGMVLGRRDAGVGSWVRGLIWALDRFGGDNQYYVYHGKDARELPYLESRRVRYVRVRVRNSVRPLRILWEHCLLPRRLRRDHIDVLHCPAYIRPLRVALPTVLTVHDLFVFTHPRFCKRSNVLHFRLLLPPSVRRAAVIHCTSAWTMQALKQEFADEAAKAHIVHPAVEGFFKPTAAEGVAEKFLTWLGLAVPPFLFVGNLEPKKNVPLILRAYAALRQRLGAARKLLLVGSKGWREGRVSAMIEELGLRPHVMRTGYVDREMLPQLYRSSLALVFPSRCEGFGLPPVEAMACGTPVICTGAAGLAESAGDAALIVPQDSVSGLAEAMYRVETDPDLRQRLSEAGLRRAPDFRWEDKVRRIIRLYEVAAGIGNGDQWPAASDQ